MREKYRQFHIKNNLRIRANVIKFIRSFFEKLEFLEVETPIRIPAPTPEFNIDAENTGDWFLHTSPELCMKRLVAAGYNKIFQISKCFRKNERGSFHLPEMTLLEWYETNSDYKHMMFLCELLLKYIALKINSNLKIYYDGNFIDLSGYWERLSVLEAFKKYASIDIETAIYLDKFDDIMCSEIEPNLGNKKPVFLYDYPSNFSSLAKLSSKNSQIAERFELYFAGIELCNSFSELTDPFEQRKRFNIEQNKRKKFNMKIYPISEPFLDSLRDMPSTSGSAMGIDRLVMIFANVKEIDEVVSFIPEEL